MFLKEKEILIEKSVFKSVANNSVAIKLFTNVTPVQKIIS